MIIPLSYYYCCQEVPRPKPKEPAPVRPSALPRPEPKYQPTQSPAQKPATPAVPFSTVKKRIETPTRFPG